MEKLDKQLFWSFTAKWKILYVCVLGEGLGTRRLGEHCVTECIIICGGKYQSFVDFGFYLEKSCVIIFFLFKQTKVKSFM